MFYSILRPAHAGAARRSIKAKSVLEANRTTLVGPRWTLNLQAPVTSKVPESPAPPFTDGGARIGQRED
jgi:hypothetical protein